MSNVLQVLLYGLLAAASPGTVVATLAVLGTKRARVNGSVFAVGFVLGQSLALFFVIAIGSVTTPSGGGSTASAALEIVVGVLLLVTAERARHLPDAPRAVAGGSRARRVLDRLERVTPRTAFSVGVTLGIGLKRLVITVLAASTIALANLGRAQELALGAFYVLLASVLVWAPITVYLVAGSRADELVAKSKELLAVKQHQVTFYTSLLFGVFFLVAGLVQVV